MKHRHTDNAISPAMGLTPGLAAAFLEEASHPVYLLDKHGRITYANQAASDMLGYSRQEFCSMTVRDIDPAYPLEQWPRHWENLKKMGHAKLEATHRSKKGELLQVEIHANFVKHGGQEGNLSFVIDIGKRKRHEIIAAERNYELTQGMQEQASALWASQERYHQLLNGSLDAIFIHSPTQTDFPGPFAEVNQAACDLLGYTLNELIGMHPSQIVDTDSFERVKGAVDALLEKGRSVFEVTLLAKTGQRIPVELNSNLFDLDGQPTILTVARNIKERKQAEGHLRDAEARYRALFEMAGDAIFILGAEGEEAGRILDANQAAADMHGYTRDELLRMKITQLDSEEAAQKAPERIKSMLAGSWLKTEITHYKKDGSIFPVEVSAGCVTLGERKVILAFDRDISKRHQEEKARRDLEAQLRQAQKLEAIGTLAGGIAHDFNNILGAITGYTELAKLAIQKGEMPSQHLDNVLTACARAKKLTTHILTFSRSAEQEYQPVKVKLVAEEALNLMKASLPSNIELRSNLASEGMCLGDPTQLHQIVMNLCTNAGQAMQETGGILDVSLRETRINSNNSLGLEPGFYLEIVTADSGPGIEPKVINRIFDPFFSTKGKGQGTGLGLSVVHGIVHNMGGGIEVESQLGVGATFRIYLPLLEKPGEDYSTQTEVQVPLGTESVLVVDDEPTLVEISKQLLEFLGYQVTVSNSSLEALELFKAAPNAYDLLITDQTMPKMSGTDLIGKVRELRRNLPAIILTGIQAADELPDVSGWQLCRIGSKPITMDELARLVREILDSAHARSA